MHPDRLFLCHVKLMNYFEDDANRQTIRLAISHWEAQTCIRFKEQDAVVDGSRQIRFTSGQLCASYIGRILKTAQPIELSDACLKGVGIQRTHCIVANTFAQSFVAITFMYFKPLTSKQFDDGALKHTNDNDTRFVHRHEGVLGSKLTLTMH